MDIEDLGNFRDAVQGLIDRFDDEGINGTNITFDKKDASTTDLKSILELIKAVDDIEAESDEYHDEAESLYQEVRGLYEEVWTDMSETYIDEVNVSLIEYLSNLRQMACRELFGTPFPDHDEIVSLEKMIEAQWKIDKGVDSKMIAEDYISDTKHKREKIRGG